MVGGKHAGFSHGDDGAKVIRLEIFFSGKFGYRQWSKPATPIGIGVHRELEDPHGRWGGGTQMVRYDSTKDGRAVAVEDIVYEL